MRVLTLRLLVLLSFTLSSSTLIGQEEGETKAGAAAVKDERKKEENDKEDKEEKETEETEGKGGDEKETAEDTKKYKPPENYSDTKLTGNWLGRRDFLRDRGIEFGAQFFLPDAWNMHGGRRVTPFYGSVHETFLAYISIKSCPLFGYEGGQFYAKFISHHGERPSRRYVGSLENINYYEARNFDMLFSLWYKQNFGDDIWLLVGKTDVYDNFCNVPPAIYFLNAAYTEMPSILFFPTYPDSAMSIIGSVHSGDLTLILGVFDGSLAEGFLTGETIFGRFFHHLDRHAFLIGEIDWEWALCRDLVGRLQIGVWKHTADFRKFNGRNKNGTEGFYLTLQQILAICRYPFYTRTITAFGIFGVGDPAINFVHRYYALGAICQGINCYRPNDVAGIAMSRDELTDSNDAGFTKGSETSYEIFYYWRLRPGLFLQPDFQYIVHPGGRNLPNASVFTLQLQVEF